MKTSHSDVRHEFRIQHKLSGKKTPSPSGEKILYIERERESESEKKRRSKLLI